MILGIGGGFESGKDTLSDFLVKNYNYSKMAFADNIKWMCMHVFGITLDECYTTEGKAKLFSSPMYLIGGDILEIVKWLRDENRWVVTDKMKRDMLNITTKHIEFESARKLLQFIGTEVLRDCIDPNIHAKILYQKMDRQQLSNVVICDARFANEREFVKKNNGMTVLVDCVQTRKSTSTHRSETSLGKPEDYDFVVVNDKEIENSIKVFHENIVHVLGAELL